MRGYTQFVHTVKYNTIKLLRNQDLFDNFFKKFYFSLFLTVFPEIMCLFASEKVLCLSYLSSDFTSLSVRIAASVTLSAMPGKKGELADS